MESMRRSFLTKSCPPSILAKAAAAKGSMAKTEDLFEEFCKDPQWAKAKLAETVSEEKARTESQAAGDMTETMLLKMYSKEVVADIVARKTAAKEYIDSPDAPGD
eukprot:2997972-Alexandrium_andersonii.AAC.1